MNVSAVVADKIQKSLPFTAFNITTECAKQGTKTPHRNVKDEVHQLFKGGQMGNFLRDSVATPGGKKCFLYYPPTLTPNDPALTAYVFSNGPEPVAVPTPAAPAATPAPTTDANGDPLD